MPRRPSMQDLSGALAGAARAIAEPIRRIGKRAWIVGGAPRDLALGREPADIDVTSAATPDEVEALFEQTIPVGRAFGTLIVRVGGIDVQLTTFRAESGYTDARRPDTVVYGDTVEGDASRRDFTCNALYLDPLDDTFADPQGGFADLGARRLRCVGDPTERFREDGLRLLRLARFHAALDLEPDPETLAAARRSSESLRGVSPERVREELSAVFAKPGSLRALALLAELELLERAIPGLADLASPEGGISRFWEAREPVLARLPAIPGLALGIAALLEAPSSSEGAGSAGALAVAERLRPSRELLREIGETLEVARTARAASVGSRSERIRWMRSPAFESGLALARARFLAQGVSTDGLDELAAERERLGPEGLRPKALLTSEDLTRQGVPTGPRFGALLREAETRQLDGAIQTRDQAIAWLTEAAGIRGQDGGKTPRSAKEIG